jgi:hypothetical protein
VGNPELWAENIAHRETNIRAADNYDFNVSVRNTLINLNENNFTKAGNLRKGLKYAKPLTKAERVQNFNVNGLVSGKDYVGGRFRGNWQVSFQIPETGTLERIDPKGAASKSEGSALIQTFTIGTGKIFMINNLLYGPRLEYEGWSKQAPAGMVGITVTEFQAFVDKAVVGLEK